MVPKNLEESDFLTKDNADEITTGSWLFSWKKAYSRSDKTWQCEASRIPFFLGQTPLNNSGTLLTKFDRGEAAHPRIPFLASINLDVKDLVSPSMKLSVAGRGGAGKGGSCVLIPDLVVMAKVGASGVVILIEPQKGRIIVDVSSGQAYLLGRVVLFTFISLMGSSIVIANQVALLLKWKKRSWMVMVCPTDRLGIIHILQFDSTLLLR
ncbi:hypothetical protein Tco_0477473 [Tanacetum coccineum]